jgi:hypothetical protein
MPTVASRSLSAASPSERREESRPSRIFVTMCPPPSLNSGSTLSNASWSSSCSRPSEGSLRSSKSLRTASDTGSLVDDASQWTAERWFGAFVFVERTPATPVPAYTELKESPSELGLRSGVTLKSNARSVYSDTGDSRYAFGHCIVENGLEVPCSHSEPGSEWTTGRRWMVGPRWWD